MKRYLCPFQTGYPSTFQVKDGPMHLLIALQLRLHFGCEMFVCGAGAGLSIKVYLCKELLPNEPTTNSVSNTVQKCFVQVSRNTSIYVLRHRFC